MISQNLKLPEEEVAKGYWELRSKV